MNAVPPSLPQTRALIISALEALFASKSYPYASGARTFSSYTGCLRDMRNAKASDSGLELTNRCGDGSRMLKDYFTRCFTERRIDGECISVNSNSVAMDHAYNLVRVGCDVLLADFSAGQFLDKPVSTFGALGMFVGTRAELKTHVHAAIERGAVSPILVPGLWRRSWGDVSALSDGEPYTQSARWAGELVAVPVAAPSLNRFLGLLWRPSP